jgi:hypothetical protein
MKLDNFVNLNSGVKSKKQVVAYDTETSYDNSLIPTITVSFNNITLDSNDSKKSTEVIKLPSSLTKTTAPCDRCHRKAKRLFFVDQHGLIYFVCHTCYKDLYTSPSKVTKRVVDLSKLTINSQLKSEGRQLKSQLNKRKRNRKNK